MQGFLCEAENNSTKSKIVELLLIFLSWFDLSEFFLCWQFLFAKYFHETFLAVLSIMMMHRIDDFWIV